MRWYATALMKSPREIENARRAISWVFFANGALLSGWLAHLPFIQDRLRLSADRLGYALLASTVGILFTMPFTGLVIHRFGSRRVAVAGCIGLAACAPMLPLATSLWMFVPVLMCAGACSGQMDVGMNTHSVAIQAKMNRPILSAVHGWFSLGGFSGGASASLAAKFGLFPPVHVAVWSAAMMLIVFVARGWLLGHDTDQGHEGPRFAVPKGLVLFLGVLVMGCFVGEGVMWDWAAVHLRRSLGATEALAAFTLGIANGGMAVARFTGDRLIERYGDRRVMQVSASVGALGIGLAALAPTPLFALAGFGLAGLGIANTVPILFKSASKVPGIPAATALTAVTSMGYAAFLGAPPLIGNVAERVSLASALVGVSVVLAVVALTSGRALRQLEPRD